MRKIDLHCYPGTQPWIDSYGPFAEALGAYWKREWVAKSEDEVIEEFEAAGVEAVLVAFDIESVTGAPPCTNDYVAQLRDRHPGTILQGWAAVDQELEAGVRSIAVPIRDSSGRVVAAINASAHAARVPMRTLEKQFLPRLLDAAQQIDAELATRMAVGARVVR